MSGSVFLSNLDDFIAPSQACVNPLVTSKLENAADAGSSSGKPGRVTLFNDYSKTEFDDTPVKPNLINLKSSDHKKVASVSLNDCLACSGCVTSAETMLIQEQSYEKLQAQLNMPPSLRPKIVIAISPNSLASIAQFLNMNSAECFLRIASVLKQLGASYVIDASSAGDVALVEAREEFLLRYKQGQKKLWERPATTTAVSATEINEFRSAESAGSDIGAPAVHSEHKHIGVANLHSHLPVLSSHCPGWVCYAEKSQPQAIPYISTVKSAQQILGSLMKRKNMALLSQNSTEQGVYFVSIQPCFDKKLEASRLDFYHTEEAIAEVDLVISTTELWRLLEDAAEVGVVGAAGSVGSGGEGRSESTGNDRMIEVREEDEVAGISEYVEADGADGDEDVALAFKKARLGRRSDSDAMVLEEGGEPVATETGGKSVLALLRSVVPDSIGGSDAIEGLCRSFSEDGRSFVSAVDRNAGSGGYSEYIFRYAAQALFGIDLWNLPQLPYKEGRNPDMAEIDINSVISTGSPNGLEGTLPDASTGIVRKLKFARAYGFRNIQSVMMKVRRGQCDLDFVEIMACPSGCNNGGGQIRQTQQQQHSEGQLAGKETPAQSRERVQQVENMFHSALQVRRPDDSPLVLFLYSAGGVSAPLSDEAMGLLHTRYHAVPKLDTIAPLATKW